MIKHFLYLKYVIRHKWFVAIGCFKQGLFWRGIKHDWSKFLTSEWFSYAHYFYGLEPLGQKSEATQNAFDAAWIKHQHRNSHHWQHWVLREDSGATKILKMPNEDVREMVADWFGAGRAITGKWGAKEWYSKNEEKILLHPETKKDVWLRLENLDAEFNPRKPAYLSV